MLQIHNTLTQKKEVFKPIKPNAIGIYVCGVTVYDYCHLGNARTFTAFDVIVRYLKWRDYQVTYVRNITDIDDKIIKRANDNKEDYRAVVERYTQAMHEDFAALGLLSPDHEPRATDNIPSMIALIEKILAHQHGYVASNGDVYFDVRSDAKYGCLSHHDIEQLESGVRVAVNEVKRDPLDFVLWKLAKPGEPSWDSPWGKGRPGWHIECSAMSMDLLGETFDLHGGGRDLIFPHHENEIAQSTAAVQGPFVHTWLHSGFLQIAEEKMSKSLGNFLTLRDALREHDAEVLRYFLLASHYRSPLIYMHDSLTQAKGALSRFYTALRFVEVMTPSAETEHKTNYQEKFIEAMDDDFNTPIALAVLFDLAHEIQRLRESAPQQAVTLARLLKKLGGVLGLLQTDPNQFFQFGDEIDVTKIESLIAARKVARETKNWREADRIRDELASMQIVIEDGATGTTWRRL